MTDQVEFRCVVPEHIKTVGVVLNSQINWNECSVCF